MLYRDCHTILTINFKIEDPGNCSELISNQASILSGVIKGQLLDCKGPSDHHILKQEVEIYLTYSFNAMNSTWLYNICMLGNFLCFYWQLLTFSKLTFSKNSFSVQWFRSRSGPTFYRSWSGSKLFANVISRWLKSLQTRKDKKYLDPNSFFIICFQFWFSDDESLWACIKKLIPMYSEWSKVTGDHFSAGAFIKFL